MNQTCLRHVPIQIEREILQAFVCQGVKVKCLRADFGGYQCSRVDEADNGLFECLFFAELRQGREVGSEKRLIEKVCLARKEVQPPHRDEYQLY